MAEEIEKKEGTFWIAVAKFFKDLWVKIILPGLKDMIYGATTAGMSSMLYHTPMGQQGPNPGYRQPQQGQTPRQTSNRPIQQAGRCWMDNTPNCYGVCQVCSGDRRTLEGVMAKMQARINDPSTQGTVSVGEMYTYANISARAEDYNDGWTSLNGCTIRFEPSINAYSLSMTEQVRL